MHDDEFDSELGVDAALQKIWERFDRVMSNAERRLRATPNQCAEIVGHIATREIENAAVWRHYGPEYEEHAERARTRAGYGVEQLAADRR